MQATTSGAIHKNKVLLGDDVVLNFLKNEKQTFESLCSYRTTLYDKNTIVGDTSLNYLNLITQCNLDSSLKNIIIKEYYACEKIYPYLGDYFLFKLFDKKILLKKIGKFSRKNQTSFLKQIKSNHVRNIIEWIFENTSVKKSINIESCLGKDISIESLDGFIFSCPYDYDFFNNLNNSLTNYKFIIVNGYIESVSEIHHLLYKANEKKEPYVIFCYGMADEVKHTIMKNNNMGRLQVYPVCLDANDENSLNILNDFAVIQGGSVVSSDLGQTISQEVRKDLSVGNEIKFSPGKIIIKQNVNKNIIDSHKLFIKKRIDDAFLNANVKLEPLQNRLKSFSSSRINIYIPSVLKSNKKILRELDYVLRFISNLKLNQTRVKIKEEIFYIPDEYIKISNEKLESLRQNFANIKAFIIQE